MLHTVKRLWLSCKNLTLPRAFSTKSCIVSANCSNFFQKLPYFSICFQYSFTHRCVSYHFLPQNKEVVWYTWMPSPYLHICDLLVDKPASLLFISLTQASVPGLVSFFPMQSAWFIWSKVHRKDLPNGINHNKNCRQ